MTVTDSTPQRVLQAQITQAYARQSRDGQEEQWILECLPMVRRIAQKISANLSHQQELEDLISAGTVGLVKAARAYDPARDAEFKTYAYIRIRGSILDEMRGKYFVPASVYNQIQQVRKAFRGLCTTLNRTPADEELAAELGVDLRQLYRVMDEARRLNFLRINGMTDDDPAAGPLTPLDGGPSPQDAAEKREQVERVAKAMQELPQRDRLILVLYYERDLTMKEIAQVLEVTESRVSQLHASALFKLSAKVRSSDER